MSGSFDRFGGASVDIARASGGCEATCRSERALTAAGGLGGPASITLGTMHTNPKKPYIYRQNSACARLHILNITNKGGHMMSETKTAVAILPEEKMAVTKVAEASLPQTQCRKFLGTLNNPEAWGYNQDKIIKILSELAGCRYIAIAEEIGAQQHTPHYHFFVVYKNCKPLSTMCNAIPKAHWDPCRGTIEQNRDYVFKQGKWADSEKGTTALPETQREWGELPSESSEFPTRKSEVMDAINEMIEEGLTPSEIMSKHAGFCEYSDTIRRAYILRRAADVPPVRDVKVHYVTGPQGSGKTYTYKGLCDRYGDSDVYLVTDYANDMTAAFDRYQAENVIVMDEFRGNVRFSTFLNLTDRYKCDIHARYASTMALYSEVYITSIYPPEKLYENLVETASQGIEPRQQLYRRISDITYCEVRNGRYFRYTVPMSDYAGYEFLRCEAREYFDAGFGEVMEDDLRTDAERLAERQHTVANQVETALQDAETASSEPAPAFELQGN